MRFILWTLFGLVVAAGTAWAGATIVDVTVPELSAEAEAGQAAFGEYCAACHGPTAGGTTDKGPPLVHPLYVESHHGDIAFFLAARQGARAHHWDFGDMEPVPDVTDEELEAIIVYVRVLQRANGLP